MNKPSSAQPIARYRQLASTEAIRRGYAASLAHSARSPVLLCLISCSVLIALSGTLGLAGGESPRQSIALWWMSCALVTVVALSLLVKQDSFLAMAQWGLLAALASIFWWASYLHFGLFSAASSILIGELLLLVYATIPWPTPCQVALTTAGVAVMWWLWGYHHLPLPLLVGWIVVMIAFIRISTRSRVSFIAHRCLDYLAKYCESASAEALPTMRLLASQLVLLAEEQRALLTFASGRLELIGSQSLESEFVDSVYPRALEQLILDKRLEQGLVRARDMGQQLSARLEEWLGIVPRHLFFVRFVTVVDSREERVCLFIPVGPNSRMTGVANVFQAMLGICAVARVYLSAARSRFISSDVLLVSQRSALDKEEELNHLIHLVNNVAQDISVQCEELRHSWDGETTAANPSLLAGLRDLETAARSLSVGVSDVKLLAELLHVSKFKRSELVEV